jgi:hypothetical protein
MTTSVGAFNDMMGQFLVELSKAIPGEGGIKKFLTSFEMLRATNPRAVVDAFMKGISPYSEFISNRDETLLEKMATMDYLKDLQIQSHWSSLSANTKNAIWQYLQTLFMLGTTISAIPQETLGAIEALAKECADKMQTDEGGSINQDALMKMIGNLGAGLGQ